MLRNYGVLRAKGDWITFLDPDDYLEPCALELLAELQSRTQADMVSGKVEPTAHYHRFQNFHLDQLDLDQVKVYDKAKALTEMLYGDLVTVSACGKLYRKELLEKAPFPRGASTKTSMLSVSISTKPNPWPCTIFRFTIITIDLVALLPRLSRQNNTSFTKQLII